MTIPDWQHCSALSSIFLSGVFFFVLTCYIVNPCKQPNNVRAVAVFDFDSGKTVKQLPMLSCKTSSWFAGLLCPERIMVKPGGTWNFCIAGIWPQCRLVRQRERDHRDSEAGAAGIAWNTVIPFPGKHNMLAISKRRPCLGKQSFPESTHPDGGR